MRSLFLSLVAVPALLLPATAGEVVLFDASTADAKAVRAQDGATFGIADGVLRVETRPSTGYPGVAVSGKWDLSACDKIEVEFVDGGIWGSYTLRLLNTGGSPQGKGCYISKLPVKDEKRIVCSQPLPAMLPDWGGVLAKLTRVRTWALPCQIWGGDGAGAAWNSKDHGVKVATLDPKDVREVAVYINTPKMPHKWGVKRIVAKGTAPDPGSVPAFARMTAKEFFPCIDGYGQFKHREWPDKTHSDDDLARQREKEAKDLAAHPGPAGWDKWGGWAAGPQLKATGSFYTTKRDGKWWIVDPDGRLWWSHGPVRVTPSGGITAVDGHEDWFERLPDKDDPEALFYTTKDELLHPYYALHGLHRTYDFSAQNIRRKYGENWFATWAELAHRRLRSWSCNTIANSSDRRICLMDKTPYTERFEIHAKPLRGHKGGWWTFSDPFDADFRAEARRMTEVYRAEFDDPWCIGFFVDNEQKWGDETTMALSTLKSPADQAAKVEFVRRLKEKYGEIAKLNVAWQADYESWQAFLDAQKPPKVVAGNRADLAAFTQAVADAYFRIVGEEIKRANPRKLYLGCRWAGWAPDFVVQAAAKHCDILSYNVYRKEMSGFSLPKGVDRPVLIGEFHFGALDRGPFCPGLILLKDQTERAETYRRYVRTSLEHPNIVGVHWHQFSDQATAGRFDGENMQVGWTDVCDTPYWETVEAVRDIGSRLYEIRSRGIATGRAFAAGWTVGADVSWMTEMEKRGEALRTAEGTPADCLHLMRDYGLDAIRLRVWVDPKDGWCGKADTLVKAKRAVAAGMDVMIDFHLSDNWADPGKQVIPNAWRGLGVAQVCERISAHVKDVLTALREVGVEPKWVQVGNETNFGVLWRPKKNEKGEAKWVDRGGTTGWVIEMEESLGSLHYEPENYAKFFAAGYAAVKSIFPETQVIVHLSEGNKWQWLERNLETLRKYGAKWDVVGLSVYPKGSAETEIGGDREKYRKVNDEIIDKAIENIVRGAKRWGCPFMIVETGAETCPRGSVTIDDSAAFVSRLSTLAKTQTQGVCQGLFYWEPTCRPWMYDKGAFDAAGRPTRIMNAIR